MRLLKDVEIEHTVLLLLYYLMVFDHLLTLTVHLFNLSQNVVIVEALKNIGGISYFPDFFSYADLNLRKHQATVCPQAVSGHILTAAGTSEDADEAGGAAPECKGTEEEDAGAEES